ncbi:hypothetical protein [Psychrobacillus sp. L3]|uniref:hypothetical protein n=1 Tax=Psychrobacillus sp. L3 TaxID=3236891 RepID=UPI0036F291D7
MIIDIQTKKEIEVCFRELTKADIVKYKLQRKDGWFNWRDEIKKENNQVFGLFVLGNNDDIQGVISIEEVGQYVFVSLMESSPHNKFNQSQRRYAGVGKNLLCFAIDRSFTEGFEGFVGLYAKKNHNEKYYQKLKAKCTHVDKDTGKPFYTFYPNESHILINDHFAGGVKICSN